MTKYQLNPLLESEGLLLLAPKKARNHIAGYLKRIRKGSKLDPVMIASTANPIPGGAVIGNAYVDAIDPYTRARAYRLFLDRPDKALVKGVVGVPKAVVKTVANVPSATAKAIDSVGEKAAEIGMKHGIDLNRLVSTIPIMV